jgi:gliding motility-associated protein GldL
MTIYSKYNMIYRLQKWMDSVAGQTFLNYAYSWGASIVILGTLFKLTHLPGANFFLFLGMGTEVLVFFISAFDRPFDKTADGMELNVHMSSEPKEEPVKETTQAPIVVVGQAPVMPVNQAPVMSASQAPVVDTEAISAVSSSVNTVSGISGVVVPPAVNPELEQATSSYVDELKRLTEMLARVSAKSERLAQDSEEMENLNRTLTGICKVYEMQLKSASSQIGTIDEINEQTRKMAEQIVELNKIYARMIEAMTAKLNV